MDATRFDALTRLLAARSPRRLVLAGIAALGIGAIAAAPHVAFTKKDKKPKKKKLKLKLNAFGCVNVGGKCRGNSANCCSGICEGRKPKKGKKDKSRCVGHDESTCRTGQQSQSCEGSDVLCTTSAGEPGFCETTTGNAAFCAYDGNCQVCAKDADCQQNFGPRAACIVCASCLTTGGTSCAFPDER